MRRSSQKAAWEKFGAGREFGHHKLPERKKKREDDSSCLSHRSLIWGRKKPRRHIYMHGMDDKKNLSVPLVPTCLFVYVGMV